MSVNKLNKQECEEKAEGRNSGKFIPIVKLANMTIYN